MLQKIFFILAVLSPQIRAPLPTKIVVIMEENHSFDHVLGALPNVDGILNANYSNPVPPDIANLIGTSYIYLTSSTVQDFVNAKCDPGEEYATINIDLFNTLDEENEAKQGTNMVYPYNVPASIPSPLNQGFVTSYINQIRANIASGILPSNKSLTDPSPNGFGGIMTFLPNNQLPVLTTIAKSFAVFDQWHCDVPSQTYPNRMFFDSATSQGDVINTDPNITNLFYLHNQTTIYDQLQAANKSWKIYTDNGISLTWLIHFPRLYNYTLTNIKPMAQFYSDAANGCLPDYSFLEPLFLAASNDYHPYDLGGGEELPGHNSLIAGEQLLKEVYDAVRTSPERDNILFVITFDEPGGIFDHIAPPSDITPPNDGYSNPGQEDFIFDRLGHRVPMIWINSYIPQGLIVSDQLQHTSFLKVIRKILNFTADPLTDRDRDAPCVPPFEEIFTLANPRPWPNVTAKNTYNPPIGIDPTLCQYGLPYVQELYNIIQQALAGLPVPISLPDLPILDDLDCILCGLL